MQTSWLPILIAIIFSQAITIATPNYSQPSIQLQKEQPPRKQLGQEGNRDHESSEQKSRSTSVQIECDPNCTAQDADKEGNQVDVMRLLNKFLADPIAILTGLITLANFGLVWLVYKQIDDARASSERQLRAYVFLEGVSISDGATVVPPRLDCIDIPGFTLGFKNSGQTPAYRMASWAAIKVAEKTEENSFVIPPLQDLSIANLGSGCQLPKFLNLQRKLTSDELADIRAFRKAIYLYGRAEYTDAFKRKRFTNFRMWYAGIYPPDKGATLYFCDEGNETEQDS